MASVPTITLDGTDIATLGTFLNAPPGGWLDAPTLTVAEATFAGGIGGVLSRYATTEMRRLQLPVRVVASSLATRVSYEGSLKAYQNKAVVVRIADGSTTREITGRCVGVRLTPYRIPNALVSDGTLSFVCADPYWRDTTDTTETISGTANALDLGTGPVRDWVLTITATTNSITDITITLGGSTLTWTGTIAAGEALVIDSSDFTVENDGVDALSTYSGGFPVLDPAASPSISASKASGSGTLGGSLVYRKRWA